MNVYVMTSNKYIKCWQPFAYLFNKNWGENVPVTLVGFELHPPTPLPRNFSFLSLGKQADFTWSQQALALADHVPDEHFILMLEDYFLDRPVDRVKILSCERYIAQHEGIAKIDLTDDRLKVLHNDWEKWEGVQFVESNPEAPFQFSLQAAIWKTSFFRRFLNANENAWMAEKNGTKRIIKARQAGEFAGVILGCAEPPMSYVNAIGGEGTMPDVWALKRFPRWMQIELQSKGLMQV